MRFTLVSKEALRNEFDRGYKDGGKHSKKKIEDLEEKIATLQKMVKTERRQKEDMEDELRGDIERLETKIEVLETERADANRVISDSLKNEDKEALLKARKESLDELAASLRDREGKLTSKEEGRYKEGYADGVADGVRKISEITQKDRDNSMKVAMVAAASHTPTANLKELNNVHQLTEGTSDSKDK